MVTIAAKRTDLIKSAQTAIDKKNERKVLRSNSKIKNYQFFDYLINFVAFLSAFYLLFINDRAQKIRSNGRYNFRKRAGTRFPNSFLPWMIYFFPSIASFFYSMSILCSGLTKFERRLIQRCVDLKTIKSVMQITKSFVLH